MGKRAWIGLIAAAAVFLAIFGSVWGISMLRDDTGIDDEKRAGPKNYVYESSVATNGMELHVLRTRPSNIALEAINDNVALTPYFGINGGFFYQSDLLSIAVVDGRPANGEPGRYGAGDENVKYARGTLVWDGATDTLGVQIVRNSAELAVTDRADFWAQGGISMSLGRDAEWEAAALAENAPFPDDSRLRSAAVYDRDGNLYLVVSATKGTLAAFREAIVEKVGGGRLADGIFLDGDGSSQLRSREKQLTGDNRPVVEMIRILE